MTRLVHFAAVVLLMAAGAAAQSKPTPPSDIDSPPSHATRTADGLIWYTLAAGSGERTPIEGDFVKVRYTFFKDDGTLVEHVPANRAAVMSFSRMIPGWREVVGSMRIGERRRAWIPWELGDGKIPPGTTYVVDTELVEIVEGPKTPADLTAPPDDAIRSRSGLVSKVLRPGTGVTKPKRRSTVRVHYSGWTRDGRLFDSSLLRGEPSELRLDNVIAGWTEGMQLMTEGEIRRFWIPPRLAYAADPSRPQGMLVFDIELLEVK